MKLLKSLNENIDMYNLQYLRRSTRNKLSKSVMVNRLSNRLLSYETYNNSYILPGRNEPSYACGGVVDGYNNKLVDSSRWHENIGGIYYYNNKDVQIEHSDVLYIGYLHNVWGHAITDNLKKIWFLFTDEWEKIYKNKVKIVYITIENKPLPGYIKDIFSLLGLDFNEFIWINKPCKFDRIIIPDNSLISTSEGRIYTKEFKNLIALIKKNVINYYVGKEKKTTFDKIYLTRTSLKDNGVRDFGESSIEKIFKDKGYEIISPEKYGIYAQIYMIMNCRVLAVTEGSISHNAIFCKENTELILLLKANYINGYQPTINHLAELNVTYIDIHRTPYNHTPWAGPFFMFKTPYILKWAGITPSIIDYSNEYIFQLNIIFHQIKSYLLKIYKNYVK